LSKRERQKRYRTTGAAANLVKVETLVPPEGRAEILKLAAKWRKRARRTSQKSGGRLDVSAILRRLHELCAEQPRRYAVKPDIDKIVTTSVNVPFPHPINSGLLADALLAERIPEGYRGHFERFLGETPLTLLLRFCDHHGITAGKLQSFVQKYRHDLALHRLELDEHLNALVPSF